MSDKQKRVKCIVCGEPGVVLCPARVGEVLDHRVRPYRAIEERWQCRRKVIRRRLGKPDLWMPQGSRTGTVGMVETDADGAFTVDLLPTVDRDFPVPVGADGAGQSVSVGGASSRTCRTRQRPSSSSYRSARVAADPLPCARGRGGPRVS